jgi:hypothetical protein
MTLNIARVAGVGIIALTILSACTTVVVDEGGPPPFRPGPPPTQGQFCPQIYAPVCGERRDGRIETLPNQCVAESRGFRVIADGECRAGPPISRPPPGRPGRPDFDRPGRPGFGGPGFGGPGRPGPAICTREYAPVCARRGGEIRTFGNACSAQADGYSVLRGGPC